MAMEDPYLQSNANNRCFNHTEVLFRRWVTTPVVILASLLSIIGCCLIMFTFLRWKDVRRSTARVILFCLAIADLLTALSYLTSSTIEYVFQPGPKPIVPDIYNRSYEFNNACLTTAILVLYTSKTACLWTVFLSIYFVLTLVFKCSSKRQTCCMMPLFHLIGWLLPVFIVAPLAATGWLGFGPYTQGTNWCFTSFVPFHGANWSQNYSSLLTTFFTVEGVAGHLPDILSFVCIMVCYLIILLANRCKWHKPQADIKERYMNERIARAMRRQDLKLLLLPLFFVILRGTGFLRYIVSLANDCHFPLYDKNNIIIIGFCIKKECPTVYSWPLYALQAFTAPLQGFVNAVIFVIFSKLICQRLMYSLLCCRKKQPQIDEEEGDSERRPLTRVLRKRFDSSKNKHIATNSDYTSASTGIYGSSGTSHISYT